MKVAVDSSSGSVVVMVPSILVVCSAAAAHPATEVRAPQVYRSPFLQLFDQIAESAL